MKVSAPGKLFLSGEWAVLEVGNPGIVTAVNKRVFAEIQKGEEGISVTVDDFGIKDFRLEWNGEHVSGEEEKLVFLKASVETALKYLKEKGVSFTPFKIRTWGDQTSLEIAGEQRKIGFGSSAASVVAVVKAVLEFHGHQPTKEELYKLSAIVHYFAQGKVGSAFDVAASTYGGIFVYNRFDAKWLISQMSKPLQEVVGAEWPGFQVEELEIPEGFELLIGWTKQSASSSAMVKQLNAWAENNQEEYKRLYDGIASLVRELIPSWKSRDLEKVKRLIQQNESLLRELGEKSGVNIETEELKKLSQLANQAGGAGKLSGAGGGDCGIAVSFDPQVSERIRQLWKEAGLYLIDATIDKDGARTEHPTLDKND